MARGSRSTYRGDERLDVAIVGQICSTDEVEEDAKEVGEACGDDGVFNAAPSVPSCGENADAPVARYAAPAQASAYLSHLMNEASGEDAGITLELLLDEDEEERGGRIRTKGARRRVTIFCRPNHRNALSWKWYLLAQHPERSEIHRELDEVLPTGGLRSLKDSPLLTRMVLAERCGCTRGVGGRAGSVGIMKAGVCPPAGSLVSSASTDAHDARVVPTRSLRPERSRPG